MVNLRKVLGSDLEMIMNWRMMPEVTMYMYTDPKLTIEMQQNWYSKIMKNQDKERYWIIQLDSGLDVGLISITNIDSINKKASWAYYLGNIEARGKGLARILECNICDYVFKNLDLNKLWCEVFEFNETVIQIHKKFGATVEGVLKDQIFKNGEYYNVVRMATFKKNWLMLKEQLDYEKLTIEDY